MQFQSKFSSARSSLCRQHNLQDYTHGPTLPTMQFSLSEANTQVGKYAMKQMMNSFYLVLLSRWLSQSCLISRQLSAEVSMPRLPGLSSSILSANATFLLGNKSTVSIAWSEMKWHCLSSFWLLWLPPTERDSKSSLCLKPWSTI